MPVFSTSICTWYFSGDPLQEVEKKGSIEQSIGLVRRTYPKKTDWNLVSQKDLDIIQDQLNNRPRKWLNFLSPLEAYAIALAA